MLRIRVLGYDYVMKKLLPPPELFPSVLGIPYDQFKKLLPLFSQELRKAELVRHVKEGERKRPYGAGRRATFSTDEDKLFFILFYYKVYPTYRLAEYVLGLDHTNIQRWKEFLEDVLNRALGYELKLPEKTVRCLDQLIQVCPQLSECIVDATERPVRRPKDPEDETKYFSGKRMDHTVKNQILINPRSKKILHVSKMSEGKKHDKKVFEEEAIWMKAPPGTKALGDSAYIGIEKLSPYIKLFRPFKKPVGGELTPAQKETNRILSSTRVRVENVFGYMKHFNILRHDFRNRLDKAQMPFETIACIYNFTR